MNSPDRAANCFAGNLRLLVIAGFFFLAGLPSPAKSQSIFGRVLSQGGDAPVPAADLILIDSTGAIVSQVQADSLGDFRLPAPGPGRYLIRASRLGFSRTDATVQLREQEILEVELKMGEEAIPLDPIVVVARKRIREGTLDEFYDRMARMKQAGRGQFLTKEQIEARISLSLPMLLQTIPGVWLQSGGQSVQLINPMASVEGQFCNPEFLLDGRPMLGGYREIQVMDLEGVEVYKGYSEAVSGHFPHRCGQIFLWRKPDWGNPFSWGRLVVASGLVLGIWALISLF